MPRGQNDPPIRTRRFEFHVLIWGHGEALCWKGRRTHEPCGVAACKARAKPASIWLLTVVLSSIALPAHVAGDRRTGARNAPPGRADRHRYQNRYRSLQGRGPADGEQDGEPAATGAGCGTKAREPRAPWAAGTNRRRTSTAVTPGRITAQRDPSDPDRGEGREGQATTRR